VIVHHQHPAATPKQGPGQQTASQPLTDDEIIESPEFRDQSVPQEDLRR